MRKIVEYQYDKVLEIIASCEGIPLSSGEIAQMIGFEQSNTASYIHHLIQKSYVHRSFYAHIDKVCHQKYFRPNITYYKFHLTALGKDRLEILRRG